MSDNNWFYKLMGPLAIDNISYMVWEHFPHYWLFVIDIRRSLVDYLPSGTIMRGSDGVFFVVVR